MTKKTYYFFFLVTRLDGFSSETAFSIIFKPECNTRELDLVAEKREDRDIWVDALTHTLASLSSLTQQREYEMWVSEKVELTF